MTADDKRDEHIQTRYDQVKSIRKTADEFGISKSTIHRKLKERECQSDKD